ncbi:MAG: hypothetical protein KF851_17365 [Pirellulaceae bacterium]|jgi:hypothetical protein|nr:hypothetical protein [Pirellulaceae bacterium]
MKRFAQLICSALAVATLTGCAMCCGPYLDHYPTFGGKVQRTDPAWGRVGSIFSDPYTAGTGPSADSNLETYKPKLPGERLPGLLDDPQPEELPSPRRDSDTTHRAPSPPPSGWRPGSGLR